jgi:hypothetical protein
MDLASRAFWVHSRLHVAEILSRSPARGSEGLIGQKDDATTLQQHLERYGSPLLNLNERADTAVVIRRREVQLCMEDQSRDAAVPC